MPDKLLETVPNCGFDTLVHGNHEAQELYMNEIKQDTIDTENMRIKDVREDVQDGRKILSQESNEDMFREDMVDESMINVVMAKQGELVALANLIRSDSLDTNVYVDARESVSTCSVSGVSNYHDTGDMWNHCSDESDLISLNSRLQHAKTRAEQDCNLRCGGIAKDNGIICAIPASEQGWRAPSSRTWEVQSISSEADEILLHTKHEKTSHVRRPPRTPLRRLLAEAEGQEDINEKITSNGGGSGDAKKPSGGWDSNTNSAKSKARSVWSHYICCA